MLTKKSVSKILGSIFFNLLDKDIILYVHLVKDIGI